MHKQEEILFANDSFYRAFLDRDLEAMAGLWSETSPVLCIHPGSPALSSRDTIISSWQGIFRQPDCPPIAHQNLEVQTHGPMALITSYEWHREHPDNTLLACNGFVLEQARYRMVFHQAGPAPTPQNLRAEDNAIH